MQEIIAKYGNIGIIVLLWLGFYVLLIVPNKKKQKKQQEMLDSIKEGTEVVTIGGIKGTVVSVNGDFVDIKVDKGVKITFRKSAIGTKL